MSYHDGLGFSAISMMTAPAVAPTQALSPWVGPRPTSLLLAARPGQTVPAISAPTTAQVARALYASPAAPATAAAQMAAQLPPCPARTSRMVEWRRRDGTGAPMMLPVSAGVPGAAWDDVAVRCVPTQPPQPSAYEALPQGFNMTRPPPTPPASIAPELIEPEEVAQTFIEDEAVYSYDPRDAMLTPAQQEAASTLVSDTPEKKFPWWILVVVGAAGLGGAGWWMMRKK